MEPSTGQQGSSVPFTKAQRIQQLGDIDKVCLPEEIAFCHQKSLNKLFQDVVSLLRIAGRAVQALGKKPHEKGDTSAAKAEVVEEEASDQIKVFQESINDFISTLRRVNEGMGSQIQGLANEGIISLRDDGNNAAADGQGPSAHQIRLEPDGDGKIGGLDPGWLNSRSNTVERNMEAELWDQADAFLTGLLEKQVSLHVDGDVGESSNS